VNRSSTASGGRPSGKSRSLPRARPGSGSPDRNRSNFASADARLCAAGIKPRHHYAALDSRARDVWTLRTRDPAETLTETARFWAS